MSTDSSHTSMITAGFFFLLVLGNSSPVVEKTPLVKDPNIAVNINSIQISAIQEGVDKPRKSPTQSELHSTTTSATQATYKPADILRSTDDQSQDRPTYISPTPSSPPSPHKPSSTAPVSTFQDRYGTRTLDSFDDQHEKYSDGESQALSPFAILSIVLGVLFSVAVFIFYYGSTLLKARQITRLCRGEDKSQPEYSKMKSDSDKMIPSQQECV